MASSTTVFPQVQTWLGSGFFLTSSGPPNLLTHTTSFDHGFIRRNTKKARRCYINVRRVYSGFKHCEGCRCHSTSSSCLWVCRCPPHYDSRTPFLTLGRRVFHTLSSRTRWQTSRTTPSSGRIVVKYAKHSSRV